jgi:hypothetical protein
MLHDFEEIIFLGPWQRRGLPKLRGRFPRLSWLLARFERMSTTAFALAVAEQFVIYSAVTVLAIWWNWYFCWLALFAAFSLHLVAHVAQWLVVRRYIPAIVTTLLALPYCAFMTVKLVSIGAFTQREWVEWGAIGVGFSLVNLLLAHLITGRVFVSTRDSR